MQFSMMLRLSQGRAGVDNLPPHTINLCNAPSVYETHVNLDFLGALQMFDTHVQKHHRSRLMLMPDQGCVCPVWDLHQLVMAALLNNLALLHHSNAVCVLDGAEAVCYNNGGAPHHQPLQGILDQPLRLSIQSTGGLVQQQNPGVLQYGPGYGHPLLLTP